MPTAAKLVAALCLAVLGVIVSEQIKELMPASIDFGWFTVVNAVLGFLCGWLVVGTRAGRGSSAAISNGFTGMVALVFWGLFVQACNEMTREAMRHKYDGAFEATAAIFTIGLEFGAQMMTANIIVTLLLGGILTGYIAEIAARNWR